MLSNLLVCHISYFVTCLVKVGIIWPLGVRAPAPAPAPNPKMRRSSTDETPYRRSPSLDSKPGSPPLRYSGEYEYHSSPFVFGIRTTPGSKKAKASYTTAQGRKYVVFYLDLSFIFLLELRRCRMAEGCLRALRYGMVFFNLLFWVSVIPKQIISSVILFKSENVKGMVHSNIKRKCSVFTCVVPNLTCILPWNTAVV